MDHVDIVTGLALVVGILLTGLVENLLQSAGLTTLSTVIWPIGYGTALLTAWYVWIRPLDFQAPDGSEETIWEPDHSETQERSAEGK
jgi:hypothetical protein